MPRGRPELARNVRRAALLVAIVASFVAIAVLRFAIDDPNEVIGFLYAVPISLAAAAFGWRGAIASAAAAVGLAVFWATARDVPFETVAPRLGTLAVVAFIVGLQANKSRRLEVERAQLLEELRRMAMLDQLTGVANRRSWDERFDVELRHAARAGHELVLVAVDLDGLKHVNDTRGHEGGDQLIRATAAALSDGIRETDFVARVGGDEFLLLLPRCTAEVASRLVERMIAAAPSGHGFSAGVAVWDGVEAGRELAARADRALYRAKAAGGARVAAAEAASLR